MKYFKNLIKRKKFGILIISLCGVIGGIYLLFWSSYQIDWSNIDGFHGFTYLMVELTIVVFTIYMALLPIISTYAQDDSDYEVRSEGEYTYIKFKNNEFHVKKESSDSWIIPAFDENKHFVPLFRRVQIRDYVNERYAELRKKDVDKSKIILKSEIVDKFERVRKMTSDEKIDFIRTQKLKWNVKPFWAIISIFSWWVALVGVFGIIQNIINNNFGEVIVCAFIVIMGYVFGKFSGTEMLRDKKLVKRIMNEDMYIVECKIYDRKYSNADDNTYFYVKITDGNYIVNQWISVTKKKYEQENDDIILYVLNKTADLIY